MRLLRDVFGFVCMVAAFVGLTVLLLVFGDEIGVDW